MRHIILISVILISGCSSWPKFPGTKEKPPVVKVEPVTPRERLTNDLEAYLIWAAIAATMAAILSFALSFKVPGLSHVSYICGIVAASCGMAIYALEWIWLIIGVSFWSLIAWGGYHLYKKSKEITRVTALKDEAFTEFENPHGHHELSPEGLNEYQIKRNKSKYWEKSPNNPHNNVTKETEG